MMTMATSDSDAAARRESRRRAQLGISTVVFAVFVAALGFRSGALAAVLAVVVAAVGLAVARGVSLTRARQLGPDRWRASLPVWVATQMGMRLRQLRSDSELLGQLRVGEHEIVWTPSRPSRRLGASDVRWTATQVSGVEVSAVWGFVPLACLQLRLASGQHVDIWVRHPGELRTAVAQLHAT